MVTSLGGECAAILARHGVGAAYRAGDVASFRAAVDGAREGRGDFDGLLAELDADRIYADYVRFVTAI